MYRLSPADLEYSLLPLWTIQSHLVGLSESKSMSISIHGYVDLHRSIILCGKYSSIDLSSIDSNGIRSLCTWLPNTGYGCSGSHKSSSRWHSSLSISEFHRYSTSLKARVDC